MNTRQDTLPMPDPANYCTVRYAAAKLQRDERTIRTWISRGILHAYAPRVAPGEEKRTMLWVPEVTELRQALERAGRLTTERAERVAQ